MSLSEDLLFLTASWVLPISSAPQKNAVVAIKDKHIIEVLSQENWQSKYPGTKLYNYGKAVLLPGLINLHTHLDYTKLRITNAQSAFFPWVKELIAQSATWSPADWLDSAKAGAAEIALSGTSCVADSSYTGIAASTALSALGLRAVVGVELFGLDKQRLDSSWSRWLSKVDSIYNSAEPALAEALSQGTIQLAIAPHAPYTVCPDLWKKAVVWARENSRLVLAHISESAAECRFLATGDAEVESFLQYLADKGLASGLDTLDWTAQKRSPVAHLDYHGLLNDLTLAAHLVHTQPHDLEILSRRQVKLAHCPRSNSRLRNGMAALPQWLKSELTWGFGTDSRASNQDLNVLNEARFAWDLQLACHPDFAHPSQEAIYALTLGAAKALRLDTQIGSLETGKYADIAVFKIADQEALSAANPYDLLFYGQSQLVDLRVAGQLVVKSGKLHSPQYTPLAVPVPGR